MKATHQFKAEHEGIKVMLRIVERLCSKWESEGNFDDGEFQRIIEFFKIFVDRCHHAKEEDLLFPAMEEAGVPKDGGPIGQMLLEHEQGRGHVREMDGALAWYGSGTPGADTEIRAHGRSYISLMTQHIEKEDTILFTMADSILSAERQTHMFEEFEKFEEEKIGKGVHEQFHRLLDDLAKRYLEEQET